MSDMFQEETFYPYASLAALTMLNVNRLSVSLRECHSSHRQKNVRHQRGLEPQLSYQSTSWQLLVTTIHEDHPGLHGRDDARLYVHHHDARLYGHHHDARLCGQHHDELHYVSHLTKNFLNYGMEVAILRLPHQM